jgi:formylmethanofuran dehydrogenase subunit A
MDRTFRNNMLERLHPEAQKATHLASIEREYSLYEIAIMTRAGAARLVGLADRGHLGVGAAADITVYTDHDDREKMFATPDYVFKDGEMVVRDGEVQKVTWGTTHVVKPEYDVSIEKPLKQYFDRYHTMNLSNFKISNDEIVDDGRGSLTIQPLHKGGKL